MHRDHHSFAPQAWWWGEGTRGTATRLWPQTGHGPQPGCQEEAEVPSVLPSPWLPWWVTFLSLTPSEEEAKGQSEGGAGKLQSLPRSRRVEFVASRRGRYKHALGKGCCQIRELQKMLLQRQEALGKETHRNPANLLSEQPVSFTGPLLWTQPWMNAW